ncbi:hypothetical protein [uncultured Bradyrhizobium sp.]|uniref:hypothetical protein n=1 Tax=uncultured Bradyrhizobium sp. TaxID=199684 RepID=UPI0035CA7734
MITRFILIGLVGAVLAGCQTTGPASVKGGECRIFERPEYAIRGKRQYDQDWIDGNIEAGVGGCGWKRPKARPASFDAAPGQKVVALVKKRSVIRRIKDRVVAPFTAPVAPVVATPPPPAASSPSTPPAPPRDAVDELLHPVEPIRGDRL